MQKTKLKIAQLEPINPALAGSIRRIGGGFSFFETQNLLNYLNLLKKYTNEKYFIFFVHKRIIQCLF